MGLRSEFKKAGKKIGGAVKSVGGSLLAGQIGGLGGIAGGLLTGKFGGGGGGGGIGNITPQLAGFSAGGLTGKFDPKNNQFNIGRSQGLSGLITNAQSLATKTGDDIAGLRGLVAPGVSALRASQLESLEGRRRKAIGNLRENLSRRRVLGSSFGSDALARAEAEFAREESDIQAQTALVELDQTRQLIQQEAQTRLAGIQTAISQMNVESALGAQLASGATAAINDIVKFQTQLAFQQSEGNKNRDAQSMAGLGQLAGTLGAAAIFASDSRLKRAIKYIGDFAGEKFYQFFYHNGAVKQFGVMAQETRRGVIERNGYLYVDYEELLSWA